MRNDLTLFRGLDTVATVVEWLVYATFWGFSMKLENPGSREGRVGEGGEGEAGREVPRCVPIFVLYWGGGCCEWVGLWMSWVYVHSPKDRQYV